MFVNFSNSNIAKPFPGLKDSEDICLLYVGSILPYIYVILYAVAS